MDDQVQYEEETFVEHGDDKAERFMRVAKVRFSNAMKAMELLQNCSNPVSYEPNPAVVDLMLEQLQESVDKLETAFRPVSLKDQNPFELDL